MFSISRSACAALLIVIGAVNVPPAAATVRANRYVKKVDLTITVSPSVTLEGSKGQCYITKTGYNLDFTAKDYPSLGTGGVLSSAGFPNKAGESAPELRATIDGVVYLSDDRNGSDALSGAVKLNVKKKSITFDEYPIIGVDTDEPATVSGTVRCKKAAVHSDTGL